MNFILVTPPGPSVRTGNAVAALRWARILRQLGHRVTVTADYADEPADTMVAIHARRSAEAIARFKTRHPKRWLILQLSGTDIYEDLTKDARPTLRSMELADRLVALNSLARRVVPRRFHKKLRVIFQSAPKPAAPRRPSERFIDVCVIGHLRDVKDPLRAALAARLLPAMSRIRIVHIGRAYDPKWVAESSPMPARWSSRPVAATVHSSCRCATPALASRLPIKRSCFRNFSRPRIQRPARRKAQDWGSPYQSASSRCTAGKIGLKSQLGDGSTFFVTLPVHVHAQISPD